MLTTLHLRHGELGGSVALDEPICRLGLLHEVTEILSLHVLVASVVHGRLVVSSHLRIGELVLHFVAQHRASVLLGIRHPILLSRVIESLVILRVGRRTVANVGLVLS